MMAKSAKDSLTHRLRLNVPKADVGFLKWRENQANPDESVRRLVEDFVKVHGYVDRCNAGLGETYSAPVQRRQRRSPDAYASDDVEDMTAHSIPTVAPRVVAPVPPHRKEVVPPPVETRHAASVTGSSEDEPVDMDDLLADL